VAKQSEKGSISSRESWQKRALYRYYQSRPGWVDGTQRFWNLLSAHIAQGSAILEVGAGPSNQTTRFMSELGEVTGIDLDPAVEANDFCTHARVFDGCRIPADDASFDASVSNYVLEHVEDPVALLGECHRVLRPGGIVAFRTPNLWHYVSLIARITPHAFHERVALKAQNASEDAHDPYPTFHRMNTRATCRKMLESAGFECLVLDCLEGEPAYGLFSRLAFYPMMAWERILNSTDRLEDLRANIHCIARKLP
jgi:ubiquinone/menaquinone biosynthesis C-methylase UbiE